MSAQVADLLDKAADVIEQHGWARGVYVDGGRVCVAGAINLAGHGYADPDFYAENIAEHEAYRAVAQFITGMFPVTVGECRGLVYEWNDYEIHTKDEVVETLRRIAAQQREKDEHQSL